MDCLHIIVDIGSSSIKIKHQKNEEIPCYMSIEPEIIEVDPESIQQYRQKRGNNQSSKHHIFLGVEGKYYAIGSLAADEFKANANLAELKSNFAVQRIMAAIWAAAQECAIGNRFSVVLSCLLPPGELADANILGRNLKEALSSFDTPSGKCRVALKSFICHPEGGGLAAYYLASRKDIGDRSVGVVMMGHRNVSCFRAKSGNYREFRSSDLGFSALVRDIQSKTSGYHERDITAIVAQYLISKDMKMLDRLLLQKQTDLRADELARLVKAIELAKSAYCRSIIQWLEIQFPNIDEFILGGGSAAIFEDAIFEVIEPILTTVPKEKIKAFMVQGGWRYPADHPLQAQLRDRFADVCCLWKQTVETALIKQ